MLSHLSRVWLSATLWTVALQAPLSVGFSRQQDWSALPCPPPGDLPDPGIELTSSMSAVSAGEFFTVGPLAKPHLLGCDRTNPLHCEWQSEKWKEPGSFLIILSHWIQSWSIPIFCPSSQSYGFSGSHVWMWELDHKESWGLKNWCFWTEVLEKTLENLELKSDPPSPS